MYYKIILDDIGEWKDKNNIRYNIYEIDDLSHASDADSGLWIEEADLDIFVIKRGLTRIRINDITLDPDTILRIEGMREKYKECTRQLCTLAETEIKNKLEDLEYEQVVVLALSKNPVMAMLITQTIMYCFFQLKLLDGTNAWDRI